MFLKNKAFTWYRGDGIAAAPGAVVEVSELVGQKLLKELPWHFEKVVGGEGVGKASPPPAPTESPKPPVLPDPPRKWRKRKGG